MRGKGKIKIVLSTRTPSAGDEEIALENNIKLFSCPSFSYHWITIPQNMLNQVISASHEAWIFTSRRGVEGWRQAWNSLPEREQSRKVPPVYVIGESTGIAVRQLFGMTDIRTTDEQNGTALAVRMMKEGIHDAIHFCGVERRKELFDAFSENHIKLTELEVYSRNEITHPDPEIRKLCDTGSIDAILFFSPDGVSGFHRLYGLPEGGWRPVAIGHTTAAAVRKATGREPRIAPVPSFPAMIRLV